MRILSLVFFSFLIGATVSCKQPVQDQYTAQLDSAITVIKSATGAANAISKEKLEKMNPVYKSYNDFYLNQFDDLSDTAFYFEELVELRDCAKYVGRCLDGLDKWREELRVTLEQLQNLKHDYQNGLLPESEVQTYLNTELFAVYQIDSEVQKYVGMASGCIRKYPELTSTLDSVRMDWLAKNPADE